MSSDLLGAPREELEFLVRSPNRIEVLETLARRRMTRRDLEDETNVSRATLARILDDFGDRGWVRETNRAYDTTPLGEYVSREVRTALERFEPVPALDEVAQWFPETGFGFDLSLLAGAEVVRPTESDALAPTGRISERIRAADRVRLVTYSVLPDVMETCWRGAVEDDLELESVLDTGAVESMSENHRLLERSRDLVESETADVYLSDGEVASTVFVVDDVVLLCLSGGEGAPLAVIETDAEDVRSWAESTIESHRRAGRRLDPSAFTE